MDATNEVVEPAHGPLDSVVRGSDVALVRRSLEAASPGDRQLLVLHHFGGWTDRELADLLGTTAGAIRKRLHDARRRLKPHLTDTRPRPTGLDQRQGPPMLDPTTLLGTITSIENLDPAIRSLPQVVFNLLAPDDLLPTGLRVIDGVVPWPRGATVDLLGPVGTGQLVLICEVAHNLAANGPAAIVAVATDPQDPEIAAARLHRLAEPDTMAEATFVITADTTTAGQAFTAAANVSGALAEQGFTVMLVIDRTTGEAIGPDAFARRVGVVGDGSVTGLRVAPHARDATPLAAWTAAAVTTFAIEQMVLDIYPAVDVLASRSRLVDDGRLDAAALATASAVRAHLETSAALRRRLAQDSWMGEAFTGRPGEAVDAPTARAELAAALTSPS